LSWPANARRDTVSDRDQTTPLHRSINFAPRLQALFNVRRVS
jgi:hypothetical protein